MNPQEREMLGAFLQQMNQAQAGQKDAEADTLIKSACAQQPDAAYLLVQRAMQLEYALQAAQSQTAKLQAEVAQLRPGSPAGFLDNANAWGRAAPAPAVAAIAPGQASAPVSQAAPVPARAAPAPASSWGSGMLGTVATTAAGVVAGSFLFQGIQNLMGHHGAGANAATNEGAKTLNSAAGNSAAGNDYEEIGPTELAAADEGGTDDFA